MGYRGVRAISESGSDTSSSSSSSTSSDSQPDTHTVSGVVKTTKIKDKWNQAPHQGIVESLLKKRDERMASVIDDDLRQLSEPMFAIDDVIYYYDRGIWLIGRVSRVIPRTSLNRRTFHQYEIVPEGRTQKASLCQKVT